MKIKDPLELSKYEIVSVLSYVLRYLLCYFTIEQVPIFDSETAQWIYSVFFGGILYSLLWGISYLVIGYISRKYGIKSSAVKSGIYFVCYIPLAIIAYIILLLLTKFELLPISQEITFNIFEWLEQKVIEIINCFFYLIFKFIIWITEMGSKQLS